MQAAIQSTREKLAITLCYQATGARYRLLKGFF